MLTEKTESFVLHFGEMASQWGFNRTVGQILALLVIHPDPLNADQIASTLKVSRGNVSMGVKELQSWRLIQLAHQPGDRKDYFSPKGSFWDMAQTVFEERRKREVDPTLSLLRGLLLSTSENALDAYACKQAEELHDLLEMLTNWADQLNSLSASQLKALMTLGTGVGKLFELKEKLIRLVDDNNDRPST